MKKIIKTIFLLAVIFNLTSCEENKLATYDGIDFIQFSDSSDISATENLSDPIVTSILLGSGSNNNGTTVNFSITSDDSSRYTVSPSSGSIEIPIGEFSADILITPIDNIETDGNLELTLELSTDNDLAVGLGGEGNFNVSRVITILDNDCAFDINDFVGTYSVSIESTAEFGIDRSVTTSTTLSLGTEPNTLVDSNFWDSGEPAVIVFDSADPSNYTVKLIDEPQFMYNNNSGLPRYAIQGDDLGVFTTCDSGFTVNMKLTREDQLRIANTSAIVYVKQ